MNNLSQYILEKFKINKNTMSENTYYVFSAMLSWVDHYKMPEEYHLATISNTYVWKIYIFTKFDLENLYKKYPCKFPDISVNELSPDLVYKIDDIKSGKLKLNTYSDFYKPNTAISVSKIISNTKDIGEN